MLGESPREPSYQPSERGLRYYRASNAIEFGLLWAVASALAGVIGYAVDASPEMLVMGGAALIGFLVLLLGWFSGILPPLAVRYRRYEIGADAVYIQRGFFTRRRAIVPFERVQFVMVRRGPVERRFELGTVVLQTAAGNESISLLDDEVADDLQARLSELARRSLHDI